MTDRIAAMEARISQVEKRQALAAEYNSWLFDGDPKNQRDMREKWAELRARHGLTPLPATTGLRFGAKIHEIEGSWWVCDLVTGERSVRLMPSGSWKPHGQLHPPYFSSRDAALSALASAPAPPGWVEPQSDKPRRYGARFIEHTLPHNKGTGYIRSADGQHELYGSGFGEARWTDEPESGGTFSEGEVDAWLARAEPPPGWTAPNPTVKPALTVEDGRERYWFATWNRTIRWRTIGDAKAQYKNALGEWKDVADSACAAYFEADKATYTECDSTGQPLSAPAPAPEKGEGDGMERRAKKMAEASWDLDVGNLKGHVRFTTPGRGVGQVLKAPDWDRGGNCIEDFRLWVSDWMLAFARSEVSRATASLARERDALREHLTRVKAENERLKPTPQPQRWFVFRGDKDHRNGTHQCWRFNGDGTGGRFWENGRYQVASGHTLAECIADKDMTEISPTTFKPIGTKRAKKKPAKPATRKKARGVKRGK